MSFEIKFIGEHTNGGEIGEVVLDNLESLNERFLAPTDYWGKEEYEKQWTDAIERIVNTDTDISSMLIVSMPDLSKADVIEAWPLYKVGKNIYLQNAWIDKEMLAEEINEDDLFKYVPIRETVSEDTGEPISEWQLSLDDLKSWLSTK